MLHRAHDWCAVDLARVCVYDMCIIFVYMICGIVYDMCIVFVSMIFAFMFLHFNH
jgi:hypothetical protein